MEDDLLFELLLHVGLFIVGFDHLEGVAGARLVLLEDLENTGEGALINELDHFVGLGLLHFSRVLGHRFLTSLII